MKLDRRHLVLSGAAAGLVAAAPKAKHPRLSPPAPSGPESALRAHLDQLAEKLLNRWPESATGLGLDTGPRAGLKSELNDASPSAQTADRAFCASALKELARFSDDGLSPAARLNKATVAYALQLSVDATPFDFGANMLLDAMTENASPYVVNQQWGAYSALPEFLDVQHRVESAEDADAYLARLHEIGRTLAHEEERIRADAGRGVIPPDFILANTIGQQQDMLAIPADKARLRSLSPGAPRNGTWAAPMASARAAWWKAKSIRRSRDNWRR